MPKVAPKTEPYIPPLQLRLFPKKYTITLTDKQRDAITAEIEVLCKAGRLPIPTAAEQRARSAEQEKLLNQLTVQVGQIYEKHIPNFRKQHQRLLAGRIPYLAYKNFPFTAAEVLKEVTTPEAVSEGLPLPKQEPDVALYQVLNELAKAYILGLKPIMPHSLVRSPAGKQYHRALGLHLDGQGTRFTLLSGVRSIAHAEHTDYQARTVLVTQDALMRHPELKPFKKILLEPHFKLAEQGTDQKPLLQQRTYKKYGIPHKVLILHPDIQSLGVVVADQENEKAVNALRSYREVTTRLSLRLHKKDIKAITEETAPTRYITESDCVNLQRHQKEDNTVKVTGVYLTPQDSIIFARDLHGRTGYDVPEGDTPRWLLSTFFEEAYRSEYSPPPSPATMATRIKKAGEQNANEQVRQ